MATWVDPTPIPTSTDPNNPDEWGQLRNDHIAELTARTNELREPRSTGWLDVSSMLAAGYEANNFGLRIMRSGNTVHLVGGFTKDATANSPLFSGFPTGFMSMAPSPTVVATAESGSAPTGTGTVTVMSLATLVSTTWITAPAVIWISTSWPTGDPWPETLPGG